MQIVIFLYDSLFYDKLTSNLGDTTMTVDDNSDSYSVLEQRITYLEGKVDTLEKMIFSGLGRMASGHADEAHEPKGALAQAAEVMNKGHREDHMWISGLTRNQHATLQMIMNNASDEKIASRFNISVSSAKSRALQIRKRLSKALDVDVRNRMQLVKIAEDAFANMDEERYFHISGFHKDWDAKWSDKDRKVNPDLY